MLKYILVFIMLIGQYDALLSQELDTVLLNNLTGLLEQNKSVELGYTFSFYSCFGETDKSLNNKEILSTLLAYMNESDANIKIIVHTDCRGTVEYKEGITLRRAQAIKEWLVVRGIDSDRIEAEGRGDRMPLVNCEDCECGEFEHQQNDRIEVVRVLE